MMKLNEIVGARRMEFSLRKGIIQTEMMRGLLLRCIIVEIERTLQDIGKNP